MDENINWKALAIGVIVIFAVSLAVRNYYHIQEIKETLKVIDDTKKEIAEDQARIERESYESDCLLRCRAFSLPDPEFFAGCETECIAGCNGSRTCAQQYYNTKYMPDLSSPVYNQTR